MVPLLGLVLLAGRAWAQPAAAETFPRPLPTVIYPSRDLLPVTQAPSTSRGPDEPVETPDDDGQVQYSLVDGVWGYWDSGRHFHPRRFSQAHVQRRSRDVTTVRAAASQAEPRVRPAARLMVFLPNSRTGSIVAGSSTPRTRGPMR
jgi:hypothetical protein